MHWWRGRSIGWPVRTCIITYILLKIRFIYMLSYDTSKSWLLLSCSNLDALLLKLTHADKEYAGADRSIQKMFLAPTINGRSIWSRNVKLRCNWKEWLDGGAAPGTAAEVDCGKTRSAPHVVKTLHESGCCDFISPPFYTSRVKNNISWIIISNAVWTAWPRIMCIARWP